MSRVWQPGVVVAITYYGGAARIALVRGRRSGSSVLEFAYADGGWDEVADPHVSKTARPLVVIDPEDRGQVERLANAIWAYRGNLLDDFFSATEQGLRDFADPKPPKPAEPTGLGAVVEDADGVRWVRNNPRGVAEWSPENMGADGLRSACSVWHNVRAVRVLSEGVQS